MMAEESDVDVLSQSTRDLEINGDSNTTEIDEEEIDDDEVQCLGDSHDQDREDQGSENQISDRQRLSHAEDADPVHEQTKNGMNNVEQIPNAPQRGAEVRQLALPIQSATSNIMRPQNQHQNMLNKKDTATVTSPVEIKPVKIGDPKTRSKITFEVVTARVLESGGKKHVAYTIIMKRIGHDPRPAVLERRYSDFAFIYECILKSFHPSILGDFLFPKKVLIGNFKAEVISERTEAFHKFLNLISSCDSLMYSDYFYSFLTSEEHNEAVSLIKLGRYGEAVPLLETIFYVREKLLTASNIMVLMCLCELVSCLAAVDRIEEAYAYTQVLLQCFELNRGHPEAECLRVAFLKMSSYLAGALGHNKKPFDRQLSEMRYAGVRIDTTPQLLEIIRDRYIHRASTTSKLS